MEVLAKGKYISISPKKAREIADLVRGKNASEALATLRFMPQVSAKEIGKVIKSAMSNAEANYNLDKDALLISKLTIDGGPTLKRWQPRAKGAAYEIKKRSSHITVVVSGDVKTKKPVEKDKAKDLSQAENPKDEKAADHKIEVSTPGFMKKEQSAPTVEKKNTFFRRKTG